MFCFVALTAMLIVSCEKAPNSKSNGNNLDLSAFVYQTICGGDLQADLFAGKTLKVGQIIVKNNNDGTINVTYQLITGYYMTESHLSVTNSLSAVPTNDQKNPQVGLFSYSMKHEPAVNTYTYYAIPVGSIILAHAVAGAAVDYIANLPALDAALPSTASIKVKYPVAGGASYFTTTVTNGGVLDGTYEGWCVDVDHYIYENVQYSVEVYSSYNPVVGTLGLVEFPENIDKVNWIINQDFVGKTSPGGFGTYTFGDVQRAIWELIEDTQSTNGLGVWSQYRVNEIKEAAEFAGEGFVPHCGQVVALMLRPFNSSGPMGIQITVAQVTLINFNLVCTPVIEKTETAWAAGLDFGGNNWAKYIYYCY